MASRERVQEKKTRILLAKKSNVCDQRVIQMKLSLVKNVPLMQAKVEKYSSHMQMSKKSKEVLQR